MASASAAAAQQPMGQKKDPFGSIDPFAAKPMNAAKQAGSVKPDQGFAAFQGADAGFSGFQSASAGFSSFQSTPKPSSVTPPPPAPAPAPAAAANSGIDHFDTLFPSSAPAASNGGGDMFGEMDDWVDVESDYVAGGDSGGTTTELDGLPAPPSGLTASAAKAKGMDNYKGGQYADAIKWLSWAVLLIEKTGKNAGIAEVLSSRASSYKEVGEYKKAIADCSKVSHCLSNVLVNPYLLGGLPCVIYAGFYVLCRC
jgi:hypothetical protein